ncbi:MAG TPA: serine/threonine-protein kinase [Acidobacteriaceae bacterium]|nr:serine/threonine-protein kinase [Acidobacteriaceae bacterium]
MTKDADNWDTLQSLFHLAEENPGADLDALLAEACADPELRRRARVLILSAREQDAGAPASAPTTAHPLTGRIGPYSIVRLLGSGGIGTVYLVERIAGGVVQRAALKVLSLHAAGPFFADRFAREQHILASLDHPNITRMLDAGLGESGEPYLAMEYVDGVHLDVYCDDRSLGVPARLELFQQVCEAVAYAHRNLVVHLDLKPSNVLVTEAEGSVKLLDFGTSKLIQPDSLLTTTVMATPAYASPEQLRNEAVTTACDVYALGAILFELLSGRRPNQDSSVAIMIERSLKELPSEPITKAVTQIAAEHRGLTQTRLLHLLRGDLATIVAKCLSPRPRDRYASVDALITDIQRYLAGRPILARPQTTTYRLAKFVRRNRTSVVAGTLAVLVIIAVSGYALWRQHQAVVAGQRALQMQNFMYQLFKLANSDYTGKPAATVPEFLQLGVNVLPQFIQDPADQRAALLSLAESMYNNGALQNAQQVFTQVDASARAAGDLASEAEAESYRGNIAYTVGQTDLGQSLSAHALALSHQPGVSPQARVDIEIFYAQEREDAGFRADENVKLLEAAVRESRARHVPEHELAFAVLSLGSAINPRGRLDEAERLTKEAIGIYGREPYAVCDQAGAYSDLAVLQNQRKDNKGALASERSAYEGLKRCSGEGSRRTLTAQSYVAAALMSDGQTRAAISTLETSLPQWKKLTGPDSDQLATPLMFLTRAYLRNAQYVDAERTAQDLYRVEKGKINPLSAQMAMCQWVWADSLSGQKRYREALPHAELADKAFTAEHSSALGTQHNAARAHALLLDIQSKLSAK